MSSIGEVLERDLGSNVKKDDVLTIRQRLEKVIGFYDRFEIITLRKESEQEDPSLWLLTLNVEKQSLNPLGCDVGGIIAKYEIVDADQQDDDARMDSLEGSVVDPPAKLLDLIGHHPGIKRLKLSKVLFPDPRHDLPELRDRITQEQHIDGITAFMLDDRLVNGTPIRHRYLRIRRCWMRMARREPAKREKAGAGKDYSQTKGGHGFHGVNLPSLSAKLRGEYTFNNRYVIIRCDVKPKTRIAIER